MRKIIFLDVDGVLNSSSDWKRDYHQNRYGNSPVKGLFPFEPPYILSRIKVDRINKIKLITNSDIVLSSAWRMSNEHKRYLKRTGLCWIAQTPFSGSQRHKEIEYWLRAQHKPLRFLVIDDDTEAEVKNPGIHTGDYLQTLFDDGGLTHERMETAIKYLTSKIDRIKNHDRKNMMPYF